MMKAMFRNLRNGAIVWALCLAMLLAACGGNTSAETEKAYDTTPISDTEAANSDVAEESAAEVAEESAAEVEGVLPPVSEVMTALEDARNYLNIMALSRETLITQLEYDGFSSEEAAAAADQCGADWNEQAVRQAQSYLGTPGMSFTYEELIDQLEYDKFTPDQAAYGADHCGMNWN